MTLRVIPESEMEPATDRSIRDGLCACFPPDVAVFSKTRAWHGSAPLFSVVVEDDGAVVAHAGVVDRVVKVGEELLRVAGIQNVFVLPAGRGRGLCDRVMEAAMEEAARRGFDAGLLFCVPDLEKVYRRVGWRLLATREAVRVDDDGREIPLPAKNIAMWLPLGRGDFPEGRIHLQGNDW